MTAPVSLEKPVTLFPGADQDGATVYRIVQSSLSETRYGLAWTDEGLVAYADRDTYDNLGMVAVVCADGMTTEEFLRRLREEW